MQADAVYYFRITYLSLENTLGGKKKITTFAL